MRAGHLVPTVALVCAAASGWLPAPTALVLVIASAGLVGVSPRVGLAAAATVLAVGAAWLGASADPVGVAPETVAGLRRLIEVFGPKGAVAATLSPHPIRAVAGVSAAGLMPWVAVGEALRVSVWVAVGALARRVPTAAWRGLAWAVGGWLAVLLAAMAVARLA